MRDAFLRAITELLPKDRRPVLVSAAIWPLARALSESADVIAAALLDVLADYTNTGGSLVMPTLVRGYRDGFCDLDEEPSTTGALSEAFRCKKGVRRARSVFSSYAILGPPDDMEQFVTLRSEEVWGRNSHLEWLEQRNAECLMIGTHSTHCVYLHRVEWLHAARIPYRFKKTIAGKVRHEGRVYDLSETIFARVLQPEARQDFTRLLSVVRDAGMTIEEVDGVPISAMSTDALRNAVSPVLERDPLAAIVNPQDFASQGSDKS